MPLLQLHLLKNNMQMLSTKHVADEELEVG